MLSTEECRRWCRSKTRRGDGKYLREYGREFASGAFLRHVGIERAHLAAWCLGHGTMSSEKVRRIARFIEDFEAGMIEFTKSSRTQRAFVVHRKTPRPVGVRATVEIGAGGPRLVFLARPERNRMPAFPDVTSAFDRKAK